MVVVSGGWIERCDGSVGCFRFMLVGFIVLFQGGWGSGGGSGGKRGRRSDVLKFKRNYLRDR